MSHTLHELPGRAGTVYIPNQDFSDLFSDDKVPQEVRERVCWIINGGPSSVEPIKLTEIWFFHKSERERSDSWECVPPFRGALNPWRRMHTENYWAWWR